MLRSAYGDVLLLVVALSVAFGASFWLSRRLVGHGTDHWVHLFLVREIRAADHRLFSRIPRLLNPSYCAAYPIFLHWCLSFLPDRALGGAAQLLNPSMNAALVLVAYAMAHAWGGDVPVPAFAGLVALATALAPQAFHSSSARNYGLSARGVGLVLFAVVLGLSHAWSREPTAWGTAAAGVGAAYLLWGFNTFGQQGLLLIAITLLAFGQWRPLAIDAAGLAVFVALHPRYGASYLKHTARFVNAYRTDAAGKFVLRYRYSLWRDLVWDTWQRFRRSIREGAGYAYNNGILVAVFLNPLVWLAAAARIGGGTMTPLIRLSAEVSAAAAAVCLLTSFRSTRFLGEPERYVELATPFGAAAGIALLHSAFGGVGDALVLGVFAALSATQMLIASGIASAQEDMYGDVGPLADIVDRVFGGEEVRFASNNEQAVKQVMTRDWSFARLWSCDQDYAGHRFSDAFDTFPFVLKGPFEDLVRRYHVNACILDRSAFSTILDHESRAPTVETLAETARFRLVRVRW